MHNTAEKSRPKPTLFVWLVMLPAWCVISLVITGYMHRNNNYGLQSGDYSLQIIDENEFTAMADPQQKAWERIPGTQNYASMIIHHQFVFRHSGLQLIMPLLLSIVTLIIYLRTHGLPRGEHRQQAVASSASQISAVG